MHLKAQILRLSLAAALCFVSVGGRAEPTQDAPAQPTTTNLDALCAQIACRKGGYEAVIRVDDKRYTTVPVSRSPYIMDDGSILIFPGETIAVQFTIDKDQPGHPTMIKRFAPKLLANISTPSGPVADSANADLPVLKEGLPAQETAELPPNTLVISYGQFEGQSGMVLEVEHNLPHTLKVDAIIALIKPGSYVQHYTSTCPIMPKMFGTESWPEPLGPLIIRNVRFLPDSNQISCQ